MIVLDLRWLLFGLLLLILIACLAWWVAHSRGRRQGGSGFLPAQVLSVMEQAPFGLLALEDQGSYRYANPYTCRLLGLPSPSGQLPEAEWVTALAQDRAAARKEQAAAGRYRVVSLGTDRFVRWWVTAWDSVEGEPATDVMFLLDATAQQRAEQSARDLFSDLSHELRTPIATILTHLEVLRLRDISAQVREQSVELMLVEARRMSRMTHALLELSRLEASEEIERRPVELLAVAEESIAQMSPQAREKNIALSLEADTPLDLVLGDAGRLKQVFLNLLENGIRYSRPGDRVTISLHQQQDGISCAVRDSGPGIPARHLPHVTRRFYRGVPEGGGGSGLGLALVQEILRHHGSQLAIESQTQGSETGTHVRFTLPPLPGEEEAT